MKTLKILKFTLVFIFIVQLGIAGLLIIKPNSALADDNYEPLNFNPQIQIPVTGVNQATITVGAYNSKTGTMQSDLLSKYIKAFYDYGLMVVGILATIVLMGAGVLWLTSGGNESKISQAKELITGSIVGLAILFGSWVLLNTINPDLLKMKVLKTQLVKTYFFRSSGFIETINDAPKDIKYGWVCMNNNTQTCANTEPPTINLKIDLCYDGTPANTKPNCAYGNLWCCGTSKTDVKLSNMCEGANDWTSCRVNSTAVIGSGYCKNNICESCKTTGHDSTNEGAPCDSSYECKSDYSLCGIETHGYCFCNILSYNCTCRYNQPLF